MSQNKTIKVGDLVRYHIENSAITNMGFVLGQFYMVYVSEYDCLAVRAKCGISVNLVRPDGNLAIGADYFAKHACPVVLPQGLNKVGAV